MHNTPINRKLISYWDGYFKKLEPKKISSDDFSLVSNLDRHIKEVALESKKILDFGTGAGYCLLAAYHANKNLEVAIGIDPSKHAISLLNQTAKLSNISCIQGILGNHNALKRYEPHFFDGIICSNVLDVVPFKTSKRIIDQLTRVIKPKGVLLIKLNFFLTEDLIQKLNMEVIDHNTYAISGVLRGMNLSTEDWVKRFGAFDVVAYDTFDRLQNGLQDRIIVLRKT